MPGEPFYLNNADNLHIRLCFATHGKELLNEGMRRLGKILASGAVNTALPSRTAGRPIIRIGPLLDPLLGRQRRLRKYNDNSDRYINLWAG